MRILYFSRGYTVHDRRFLQTLADSRHEGWFLRLDEPPSRAVEPSLPEGIRSARWEHEPIELRGLEDYRAAVPSLKTFLDGLCPDLVHAGPVQSCGLLTALTGFRPLLLMSWGSDVLVDADLDDTSRWMTRYALEHSDLFLCDCNAVRLKAQSMVPIPDGRIVQFPWGIDLGHFMPGDDSLRLRGRPGWEDALILVSTRSWEPLYGIESLVVAFRTAHAEDNRLRLVLLGAGSLRAKIRQYLKDHDLQKITLLPGVVPNEAVVDYFRAADVYVSAARSDGTSVSLLEAMATGLPVVVTDNSGNREWVVPGRNGWLVPADRPDTLATSLLRAARMSPEERRRIARANRNLIERRADWKKNSQLLLEAYDRLSPASAQS